MSPQGGLPALRVPALVDRHVATGPGRYELAARLRVQGAVRPIRVRYTATWGSPVPVDAPRRVALWSAPLQDTGGAAVDARVDLLRPGLGARGVQGRALVMRDEAGAILAILLQGAVGRAGGARGAVASGRAAGPPRGRGGLGRGTPSLLVARVSTRVDYSEVSRGDDLCLVTREHRSVEVRVGEGPGHLVRVGGSLDLEVKGAAGPHGGAAPVRFRVVVLDASVVTARPGSCVGEEAGRLALVIVRRGAP